MAVSDDLVFFEAFLTKYQDTDCRMFSVTDPMTALSEGLNNLRTVTEGRGDMAGPMQDLMLALRGVI